jgi:hypothetical protein
MTKPAQPSSTDRIADACPLQQRLRCFCGMIPPEAYAFSIGPKGTYQEISLIVRASVRYTLHHLMQQYRRAGSGRWVKKACYPAHME